MPKRIFELKKTTFGEKKSIATTKENTEPYQHKAAAVTVRTSRKKKKNRSLLSLSLLTSLQMPDESRMFGGVRNCWS